MKHHRTILFVLHVIVAALACAGLVKAARAETMVIERIVPEGATLTYSEGGVPVRMSPVPAGRVRVTIEYGNLTIKTQHRRK